MYLTDGTVTVATADYPDLKELAELHEEACLFFEDDCEKLPASPGEALAGRDLPEGGLPENYELLTIRISDMLIGYASVYRDFPKKRIVRLRMFYIGAPARGKGFGSSAIEMIIQYFYETGYASLGINCSLKNWGALRFLQKHGFTHISAINASGNCSGGEYGGVSLVRYL